jgi:hypothetical protein
MDLINIFKFIGNSVCKNNISFYFLALFFHSLFSYCNYSVYTEGIFLSVFTDGYCENIFNRKNSPQFTNKIFLSVCTLVFANFLAVFHLSFGILFFFKDSLDIYWFFLLDLETNFHVILLNWCNILIHSNSLLFILYCFFKHYRITCSKVTI